MTPENAASDAADQHTALTQGWPDCAPEEAVAAVKAARHKNWQVALDALVGDAPSCGLDPFKVRKRVERVVSHYKSDRTRYDVIRHMHDAMLSEAHRGD